MEHKKSYPLVKSFLAGSFSGTCSTILFQPLDLVKTRLQNPTTVSINGRHVSVGMYNIFATILQEEQLKGLWKGMTPSLARCVPGVGLYFCTIDFMKSRFFQNRAPGPLEAIAMGLAARSLSGAILIPITVIKTRYESGVYNYSSMRSALKEIYLKEGFKGMTCGLLPTLFRDAPFSGLYLMFYLQAKKLVPFDVLNSPYASPAHFTCGVTAGILASFITQPADVIKTKMQLYPDKFQGVWSAVTHVHTKYGVKGYFKGIVPRMLRRTLMAAMSWTIYERVSQSIGLK
ncbi:mitochondrial glycine transporter A-like isoform X2 [Coccinella septempunctata]|uniref:mitochondrial glycine transporter A-like isoform X2 n=1 Tax=Coccinella septempunctata TaxID=41139 RepID=UPI001D06CBB9|nr:mitochondrial glycine transporter A-like isoform X2 [Coccinella septempunctata]